MKRERERESNTASMSACKPFRQTDWQTHVTRPTLIEYFPSCTLWDNIWFSSPFLFHYPSPYLIFLPFRLHWHSMFYSSSVICGWNAEQGKKDQVTYVQIHVLIQRTELNSVEHEIKWTSTNERETYTWRAKEFSIEHVLTHCYEFTNVIHIPWYNGILLLLEKS
jgi:hypothetical protein